MRRFFVLCGGVVLVCFFAGCGTTGKFVYPARMNSLVHLSHKTCVDKSLAVLSFDDYRSDDNSCMIYMYLISLMPFGWVNYDRPDAAKAFLSIYNFEMTPSEDLAKDAAVSFRHPNLFCRAFFSMGGTNVDQADFVLHGRINELVYNGKIFTYGLSVYGPILWGVGALAGKSNNRLSVSFTLQDKQENIVWEWTATKEDSIVQWIYSRMGHDCRMFTYMYQDIMNDAVNSLAKKIRDQPALLII